MPGHACLAAVLVQAGKLLGAVQDNTQKSGERGQFVCQHSIVQLKSKLFWRHLLTGIGTPET